MSCESEIQKFFRPAHAGTLLMIGSQPRLGSAHHQFSESCAQLKPIIALPLARVRSVQRVKMKNKTLFITVLVLVYSSAAFAAQTFTGRATLGGHDCDIYPSRIDAENDCLKQANEFCSTFDKRAVRVSNFDYSNTCKRGTGYANGDLFGATLASAAFNCKE